MSTLLDFIQRITFSLSYSIHRMVVRRRQGPRWVVGVVEVASVVQRLGAALPDTVTVVSSANSEPNYDWNLGSFNRLTRIIGAPWLMGQLAASRPTFIYVWSLGFTRNRGQEMKQLRNRGIRVVTMFVGGEIRSPELQREVAAELGHDTLSNYAWDWAPPEGREALESRMQKTAREANLHASVILSAPVDQRSYLPDAAITPYCAFYGLDDGHFNHSDKKFDNLTVLRIVHAPSSPDTKGTAVVRAVIAQLRRERDDFEYVELTGQPNSQVIQALFDSHICLNQFFAYLPGVLGIEAMAARCAVLMSADPEIERALPTPDRDAWMITRTETLYDNLRSLLDSPALVRQLAESGFEYAHTNFTYERAANHLVSLIESRAPSGPTIP